MGLRKLTISEGLKASLVGIATALMLTAVMTGMMASGFSALPKPLGLAFAETVIGRALPLPVGLLFHVVYVMFWSVFYVSLSRDTFSLVTALILGGVLWVGVLVVFFPIVGWGFLGLAVSPKLIVASLVPHILFAVILWGLCCIVFKSKRFPA